MALSPTGSRGGTGTVTGVTAADTSIVVAGTAAAPTLATGTLDVLATNHPPAADVALNAKKITGLGTPTLSTDAVTKAYTDAAINGLDWKQAARLASAVALPANTYVNGASGVGATLTGNAFGALTIDGVAVAVNDRVLLKTEVTGSHNGIYSVTATGGGAAFYVLTRTADYNTTAEIVAGTGLYVTEGTANADTSWVMTTTGAVTVGTTALTFTQFGGGGFTSQPFAYFEVDNTALANGALFTWTPINSVSYPGNVAAAAAIFNLADPTSPAAQADCRLDISIEVKSNSAHAGKTYGCFLGWDSDGVDDGPALIGFPLDASFTVITLASSRQLSAGQKLQAQFTHDVGGNLTVDFWALVQKLA